MRRLLPLCSLALLAGCHPPAGPPEKYFSGEPVAHWLEAVRSPDAKVRKHAVDVLGNVGPTDPGAIPALIVALGDKDAKVRTAAVLGLSKIGPPAAEALPALEQRTKDTDANVRKHAVHAVARIQGEAE